MKLNKKFWIIAIMILIVVLLTSSVVAASLADKAKGQAAKLKEWRQKFFTVKILINTICVFFLIFIGVRIFDKFKGTSYSGKDSKLVLIGMAVFALVISIQFIGPTEFLWEKEGVRSASLYFLGDKNCEYDLRQAEIDGLVDARNSYLKKEKTVIEGKEVEVYDSDAIEEGLIRGGLRKIPLGTKLVDSAEGVVASYDKKIEVVEKDAANSKKFCYTAASKLPKAERPDNTSPSEENPLLGWGILRGGRLFILIGSLLIYFLLFKIVSPNLDKTARVALTIMFAANTAQSNLGKAQFLGMAYWVLLFLLYKTFVKQTGQGDKTGEGMAWGLSFGVVHTMATTTFRQYGLGLPMFPQTGDFISNFIFGFVFGIMIGMFKGGQNSFFGKRMANVRDKAADKTWEKKGSLLKWATSPAWVGPYLLGWGAKGAFKKYRSRIGGEIKQFGEEAKLLSKENNQRIELMRKKDITEDDQKMIDGITWGSGNLRSRTIKDMKGEIMAKEDVLLKELSEAMQNENQGRVDDVKIELRKLQERKDKFVYSRKNDPSPDNPTYDGSSPTFNKSVNGILQNLGVEIESEQRKMENYYVE